MTSTKALAPRRAIRDEEHALRIDASNCPPSHAIATSASESVAPMVEDVVGCKWTLQIMKQIRAGVVRPGALERAVEGLTTKVMNERLRKLVRYGLLEKRNYSERLPRVEYRLTPFGRRLSAIVDQIERLERTRRQRRR